MRTVQLDWARNSRDVKGQADSMTAAAAVAKEARARAREGKGKGDVMSECIS